MIDLNKGPAQKNDLESLKTNVAKQEDILKDNNPLIEKLLSNSSKKPGTRKGDARNKRAGIKAIQKVVLLRYKIYAGLVLFMAWYIWGNFLQPAIERHTSLINNIESKETQLLKAEKQLRKYKKDNAFVSLMNEEENKEMIYACINEEVACDDIIPELQEQLDIVKAYLQIGNLYDNKMLIDEKSLLINLDAYMTRQWKNGFPTEKKNGEIQEIKIGEPKKIIEQLHQAPVELVVEFYNKDGLISFVDNIENRIIKGIDATVLKAIPVLYFIEEIAYDIVKYQEEQRVKIEMTAYYYHEERETWLPGETEIVLEQIEQEENKKDETTEGKSGLKVEKNEEEQSEAGEESGEEKKNENDEEIKI